MKKSIIIICSAFFLVSCVKETPKARLLEFEIDGHLYSYEGYAYRYNDYNGTVNLGYDWNIYNSGQSSINIQAFDDSFTKNVFSYPDFWVTFTVEMAPGQSKTYEATGGELRFLGQKSGDITGDFHFKMKNVLNPLDSVMIQNGYFRIWLEKSDRVLSK